MTETVINDIIFTNNSEGQGILVAVIGIDLGTTNSLAVCWKNGKAELIKNSMDEIYTPSAVSIDENGEILIGKIARERLISHPDLSASEFKRDMGMRNSHNLGGRSFTPEELSSLVLRKIKEDAEAFLGEPVEEAVISVPAYFDDNCRNATKTAARLSGLKVERLVNEPSAAALAYLSAHDYRDGTFMIVDFGGGTLDVSVVDAFDSVIEILAVAGNNHLGGKDFNEAIARYFCSENGLDYDSMPSDSRAVIYRTAENCKQALSASPMTIMAANINGKQYSISLDNNRLIEICSDIFEKISQPIRKVIHDSRCSVSEIDDIILVGGSCRMPTVRAYIEKTTGRSVCTDINPDTAIAVGAGIFAGIKSRNEELKDVILTDICPFSLGTNAMDARTGENLMSFIIERNTSLPASRVKTFYAGCDDQKKVSVHIYQGESMLPLKNLLLGELILDTPPVKKGEPIISVRLTYDINGILIVDVTTLADNKTQSKIFLSRTSTLTEDEIENARKRMEKLKISPAENEENRLLIARAERIFEESLSVERDIIMRYLGSFKSAVGHGNSREIRIAYEALDKILDRIEGGGEWL